MTFWTERVAPMLRGLHIGNLRSQILAFAVAAALLPTLVMTIGSYRQSRRLLSDDVAHELSAASTRAARQTEMWLDDRLADLRAAATFHVFAENLDRVRRPDARGLGRLREYLNSVRERSADQEALFVIDPRGRVVTSNSGRTGGVRLLPDALIALITGDAFLSDAYWDTSLDLPAIVIAVPIREADGRFLAAFTAKINLRPLADRLQRQLGNPAGEVQLVTEQGQLVITSRGSSAELMRTSLPDSAARALFDREGEVVTFRRADGEEAVGALRRVPELRWAAVAELPRAAAFRALAQLRNATALRIAVLLALVVALVYALELLVVRPLGRLGAAATKVAAGDLSVELTPGGIGEVGALTRAFATLAGRLRERATEGELERLSVTDALTGLYNRRYLTGTLATEAQRARRLRRPFAVLLLDVDHFKQYNDTHGHVAGDAALATIAEILRKQTRAVDCVARYGGEEFLVVLLETTVATGALVGERIRAKVAAEKFAGGQLTVSIGVAECPAHGDTPESLIGSADAAMYEAKGAGRNRLVAAGERGDRSQRDKRRRKAEGV